MRSATATASVRAAEAKFTAKGGMSRLNAAPTGNHGNGAGSFGGGGSGKSMDAALHANTGWIEAPEMSGGDGGALVGDGGDPEEMSQAAESFTEAMSKLWRRLFGGKSVSPPPRIETSPSPPGEELGDASASRAVAMEATPEPKREPVKVVAIQRTSADPAKALGEAIIAYAGMQRGFRFDGLAEEYRSRVDALEPHYRESLAGTGRHYPGLKALIDKEGMQERSRDYERVYANNLGAQAARRR